jgi:hypothetical protein
MMSLYCGGAAAAWQALTSERGGLRGESQLPPTNPLLDLVAMIVASYRLTMVAAVYGDISVEQGLATQLYILCDLFVCAAHRVEMTLIGPADGAWPHLIERTEELWES